MSAIEEHLLQLEYQLEKNCTAAGRHRDEVRLIAVSKTRSQDEVKQAIEAGQYCFGENRLQDALQKITYFSDEKLEWHFIGHLQSKKSRQVVQNFQWLHTLDSIKLAQKLSAAIQQEKKNSLNCLLQINLAEEESKSGLIKNELFPVLDDLLKQALPGLVLRGLMTIGVHNDDTKTEKVFAELRELAEQCRERFALPEFDQLSMGMSNDYEQAIRQGATMIRVGTAIFGER